MNSSRSVKEALPVFGLLRCSSEEILHCHFPTSRWKLLEKYFLLDSSSNSLYNTLQYCLWTGKLHIFEPTKISAAIKYVLLSEKINWSWNNGSVGIKISPNEPIGNKEGRQVIWQRTTRNIISPKCNHLNCVEHSKDNISLDLTFKVQKHRMIHFGPNIVILSRNPVPVECRTDYAKKLLSWTKISVMYFYLQYIVCGRITLSTG